MLYPSVYHSLEEGGREGRGRKRERRGRECVAGEERVVEIYTAHKIRPSQAVYFPILPFHPLIDCNHLSGLSS